MRKKNPDSRPIDLMRDGPGNAAIPAKFGNIVAMMTTEERIYLIGERGISSGVFADQIDPQRKTLNIPQIVQRDELNYGAESSFVQRTVCAAAALLDPNYLPDFPKESGLMLALRAAQDLAAVTDIIVELRQHEAATRARLAGGEITRKHLPSTPNLKGRTEQAINHLRKVRVGLLELSGYFYPKVTPKSPWSESVRAGFIEGDPFHEYLTWAASALNEIANCRNAMIHPDHVKSLEIFDYDMNADAMLIAPSLQLNHPDTPLARRDVVQYLERSMDQLVDIFATFLSEFCHRAARSMAPIFVTQVSALPDGQLRSGSPFVWVTRFSEGYDVASLKPGSSQIAAEDPTA